MFVYITWNLINKYLNNTGLCCYGGDITNWRWTQFWLFWIDLFCWSCMWRVSSGKYQWLVFDLGRFLALITTVSRVRKVPNIFCCRNSLNRFERLKLSIFIKTFYLYLWVLFLYSNAAQDNECYLSVGQDHPRVDYLQRCP